MKGEVWLDRQRREPVRERGRARVGKRRTGLYPRRQVEPAGFLTNGGICLSTVGLQAPGQSLSIAAAVVSGSAASSSGL